MKSTLTLSQSELQHLLTIEKPKKTFVRGRETPLIHNKVR